MSALQAIGLAALFLVGTPAVAAGVLYLADARERRRHLATVHRIH